MIFQGIQTSIAKKPYIFVIFQGGGGGGGGGQDPLSPPLDPHMDMKTVVVCKLAFNMMLCSLLLLVLLLYVPSQQLWSLRDAQFT